MLLDYDKSGAMSGPTRFGLTAALRRPPSGHFSAAGTDHLNVEIANFLPQRIAVHAKQIGRPDLIAARRYKRRREQRILHFAQNAVVQAGRRQAIIEAGEIAREI